MHCISWLMVGFLATMAQLAFEVIAQQMRLTRMSLPFMLGTMYTEARSRAKLIGFANHLVNGFLFSGLYIAIFAYFGRAGWWFGGLLGLGQAAIVLLIAMPFLPDVHPRMATETQGPTVKRRLEPPGFLALNYGPRTPIAVVISHVLFGVVFGALYRM